MTEKILKTWEAPDLVQVALTNSGSIWIRPTGGENEAWIKLKESSIEE